MLLGIFVAHVVSRTWPLLLIRLMPHVGDAAGSKSKPLADQISTAGLLVGGVWCLCTFSLVALVGCADTAIFIGVNSLQPLLAGLAASALAWAYMGRLLWRRLQGFTGDGLDATQQVCEVAFYLGLAVALPT